MLFHQPEQCVDTAVGLFIESGIKLLQQSEILHCVKRKAKVQPPFQFIGQRQQTDAEYFGMRIEINRNVLYIQFFPAWQQRRRKASVVVNSANSPKCDLMVGRPSAKP